MVREEMQMCISKFRHAWQKRANKGSDYLFMITKSDFGTLKSESIFKFIMKFIKRYF